MKARFSFVFILVIFSLCNLQGQLNYTRHFTKKLSKGFLEFYEPTESWFKPIPLSKDDFMKYDLVLLHTDLELEIRCIIEPVHKASHDKAFPHINSMAYASTLASNNPEFDMVSTSMDSIELDSIYHADWGSWIDFKPKSSLTDKANGRILSLFAENKSRVHLIFLYDAESYEIPEHLMQMLRFEQ